MCLLLIVMKLEKSILEFKALRVNRNTIKMGAEGRRMRHGRTATVTEPRETRG